MPTTVTPIQTRTYIINRTTQPANAEEADNIIIEEVSKGFGISIQEAKRLCASTLAVWIAVPAADQKGEHFWRYNRGYLGIQMLLPLDF